jgi:ribA/ribD-fused uncharacterized protein
MGCYSRRCTEWVEGLRQAVGRGTPVKFVFFWAHRSPRDGSVSSSCLSQWYAAPFVLDGTLYQTAEHYMMARKAEVFGDLEARRRVMAASKPGAAKAIGREVRGFEESVWARHRFSIAVTGNLAKFRQNSEVGWYLDNTKRRVLAEASPVDRIWGIGLEASDPKAYDPAQWEGLNLLGFALMEARTLLTAS